MSKETNPLKNRLSEQLPTHAPDQGSWDRISAKLDFLEAEAAFQEKLEKLPTHSPDPQTWNRIYLKLNRAAYYKTGMRIGLSAAAGLLLLFTVSRFFNSSQIIPKDTVLTERVVPATSSQLSGSSRPVELFQAEQKQSQKNTIITNSINTVFVKNTENRVVLSVEDQAIQTIPDTDVFLVMDFPVPDEGINRSVAGSEFTSDESYTDGSLIRPAETSILFQKQNITASAPPKFYTPVAPDPGGKGNYFALGMNYLPENIYNGTENTLFHNLALTASFNKEKTRFNTSLGMAYNEDQFNFEMNYDVKTPVTAPGPGGTIDTLSYKLENMDSEYTGTEKHQYFTYNLGLGKRLFSLGKFSSWINAGAGFGIQVNNPDLIASTAQTIKGQPNAQINSVYTEKPEYTDYNINFVTGIDFNYQIINRLSISFAPTSRWYFKPMLVKDNQPTDELSLGFTTGMKFDF